MPRHSEFVDFVLEQLAPLGKVHARAMFGAHGIYCGDRFFAIISDDRLYFKTDPDARPAFEALGLGPFTYEARGKTVSLQYYEAPPEVFDEAEAMCRWAQLAVAVAGRAPRPGKASARKRPSGTKQRRR